MPLIYAGNWAYRIKDKKYIPFLSKNEIKKGKIDDIFQIEKNLRRVPRFLEKMGHMEQVFLYIENIHLFYFKNQRIIHLAGHNRVKNFYMSNFGILPALFY